MSDYFGVCHPDIELKVVGDRTVISQIFDKAVLGALMLGDEIVSVDGGINFLTFLFTVFNLKFEFLVIFFIQVILFSILL